MRHHFNKKRISGEVLIIRKLLEVVGCASHSDFQSERDKVLSLIRCFIEHEGFNCGETDAIKEYMEELRQAGEP
jgi:predicted nucleic-acid-binding protein